MVEHQKGNHRGVAPADPIFFAYFAFFAANSESESTSMWLCGSLVHAYFAPTACAFGKP